MTDRIAEKRLLARRRLSERVFRRLGQAATWFGVGVLGVLLVDVFTDGLPRLGWEFLTSFPSRRPEDAGIYTALIGSIWMLSVTGALAFPLGVGAAIYLEEYSSRSWIDRIIEINIANLAGVPSIIYGLLGLEVFVRMMGPITGGRSVLAGGMTMALLVMPIIIIAAREALRAVPDSLRQGGYALGATRWQVVSRLVVPSAMPGILTGTILALARAIGETAPLITIGALTYVAFVPELSLSGLQTPFTALPIQIFNWVSRPQAGFHVNAAAGIVVLLAVLITMNATAVLLRHRYQRRRGMD
jgi:phosphate transport system permease protein